MSVAVQEQLYGYLNVHLNSDNQNKLMQIGRVLGVSIHHNTWATECDVSGRQPYEITLLNGELSYINTLSDVKNVKISELEDYGYDCFEELAEELGSDKTIADVIQEILQETNVPKARFELYQQVITGIDHNEIKMCSDKVVILPDTGAKITQAEIQG